MSENFSDGFVGKIVIGVVVFTLTGILGYIGGRVTSPDEMLVADIRPSDVSVAAGEAIQFSALESTDPKAGGLEYVWSIGGYPHERSTVGYCDLHEGHANATCMFSAPGNFSVSVKVVDTDGNSDIAISPVSVSMAQGFIGLVLNVPSDSSVRDNAYTAILMLLNWQEIQRAVSRPILLYNPEINEPIFAATLPFKDLSDDDRNQLGAALQGVRLISPRFHPDVVSILTAFMEAHGGSVIEIPFNEIRSAVNAGLSGAGFVPVDSMSAYIDILSEFH